MVCRHCYYKVKSVILSYNAGVQKCRSMVCRTQVLSLKSYGCTIYFKLPFLLLTDIYFYLYTSILLFIYLLTDIKIEINGQTLNREGEREVLPLSKYSIPLPYLFQTSISSSPSLSRSWILKYIQDIPKKKKNSIFQTQANHQALPKSCTYCIKIITQLHGHCIHRNRLIVCLLAFFSHYVSYFLFKFPLTITSLCYLHICVCGG